MNIVNEASYKAELHCRNCCKNFHVDIPFGTTIDTHLHAGGVDRACDACGCTCLERSEAMQWGLNPIGGLTGMSLGASLNPVGKGVELEDN